MISEQTRDEMNPRDHINPEWYNGLTTKTLGSFGVTNLINKSSIILLAKKFEVNGNLNDTRPITLKKTYKNN